MWLKGQEKKKYVEHIFSDLTVCTVPGGIKLFYPVWNIFGPNNLASELTV